MADTLAAVVAILSADTGLAAEVGSRIYGGELPAEQAGPRPLAALVASVSGGVSLTGDTYAEFDTRRFDLFAYGRTQSEAVRLADRAELVLRRVRRGVFAGVLVHWVSSAGGATDGRDPALTWPRAFRSFQIAHALEPVA